MKLATAVATLGLSVLALLGTAPGVSRAETFHTDYVMDFHLPDPGLYDCSTYTLQGTFDLYFQPTATRALSWLAQTPVVGVGFNESRSGSLSFCRRRHLGSNNLHKVILAAGNLRGAARPDAPGKPALSCNDRTVRHQTKLAMCPVVQIGHRSRCILKKGRKTESQALLWCSFFRGFH